MIYYNQNDYDNIPYPSPTLPNATVKSGGCGAVCASILIENLTGESFPPEISAEYSITNKARVNGGTDMKQLSECLSRDFNLTFTTSNDESVLKSCLKSGGMAIANVGGDRNGYVGVFSNSGHYVVVVGLTNDEQLIIADPGMYNGKFNKKGRKEKVKINGNEIICSLEVLHQDTFNRNPNYYLFNKENLMENIKDVVVTVGNIKVPAKLIGSTTYAELRPLINALNEKQKMIVTWTEQDGAGVE